MRTKKDKDGDKCYFDSTKLPSGQTIKIEFQEDFYNDKFYYNIYLSTMHKRRQEDHSCVQRTGKDGLKGMFWAKEKIKEFEEFIKDINGNYRIIMICNGTCRKRKEMYYKGLKEDGYEYSSVYGHKVLKKELQRGESNG